MRPVLILMLLVSTVEPVARAESSQPAAVGVWRGRASLLRVEPDGHFKGTDDKGRTYPGTWKFSGNVLTLHAPSGAEVLYLYDRGEGGRLRNRKGVLIFVRDEGKDCLVCGNLAF
jgi:hypothetical protein